MKDYYTLKELAEIVGVTEFYMKNYTSTHFCSLIEMKSIHYKVKSKKYNKVYENHRPMYVVHKSKLDDFVNWWETRPIGRRSSKTITEGGLNYKWTETAIDCFNAKQICQNCSNYEACENIYKILHKKPIKEYVRKTYALIGAPIAEKIEN